SRRRHTRSDRDWSSDVCSSDLLLRLRGEVLGVLDGNLREDLLRLPPVALERHQHRHLVPDVAESLVVVGDRIGEDLPVRDVDDRSEERRVGKGWGSWWVWCARI